MQMMMPLGLPAAPSHTATMTPLVSTSSEKPSNLVGTFFSMLMASRAVATGIDDLRIPMSLHVSTQNQSVKEPVTTTRILC